MVETKTTASDIKSAVALLAAALERESVVLRKKMNENEKITRETVNAEVEAKNNVTIQKALNADITRLKVDIGSGQKDETSSKAALDKARMSRDTMDREIAELKKSVGALQNRTAALDAENTALKSTVAKQESKRDKLHSDVTRLKDLRSKYMAEIAEFKSTGDKESF
ncbi:MAG: hypothetical protein ABIF71_02500 [Planctomycetota bacterium]